MLASLLVYATLWAFTMANFYPDPLDLVTTSTHRIEAKWLSPGLIDRDIQDAEYGLRRINLPRTPVNRARGRADPLRADPLSWAGSKGLEAAKTTAIAKNRR